LFRIYPKELEMQLNPYLFFDGNCRDAMNFYKDALNADLKIQTVGETPAAGQMPLETHARIMHAVLSKGGPLLMASDMMGPGLERGNGISLTLNCSSDEEIKAVFERLSAGGEINSPLKTEFWGGTFGQLTDKFGIMWMLSYEKK
jgi:PhnB protein